MTHCMAIIDQVTLGHKTLHTLFGQYCSILKIAWSMANYIMKKFSRLACDLRLVSSSPLQLRPTYGKSSYNAGTETALVLTDDTYQQ